MGGGFDPCVKNVKKGLFMTRLEHQNCSQICLIRTILLGSGAERSLESSQGQVSLIFLFVAWHGRLHVYSRAPATQVPELVAVASR